MQKKQYRVTVYETADGWRWRMIPKHGGKTVDASTESFTRKATAKRNAASSTGATFGASDVAFCSR